MRVNRKKPELLEGDLTPMIDMTFQLIAFFMVLINFAQTDQNDKIKLPESELAKPPEMPLEFPITLHLTKQDTVIIGGQELRDFAGLRPYLAREKNVLELQGQDAENATIVIRADVEAKTGKAQELIKVCQENKFEKFALRAEEKIDYGPPK
jgi:biopolymer transport protein ExbD